MEESEKIPVIFIKYASDILGDTANGLSGTNIISATTNYAVEYDVNLPHSSIGSAPNKRTVLYDNLKVFSGNQQYRIIKELCDHPSLSSELVNKIGELKNRLYIKYSHLSDKSLPSEVNEKLIQETRCWLNGYSKSLDVYSQALEKYEHRVFQRNLLDDLRLSLELLLKDIFDNSRSLENQTSFVGAFIKERNGSSEFNNMFLKLLDYYAKYNNTYIKHDDAVIEEEIEFILEITSSFMKHLIRLHNK